MLKELALDPQKIYNCYGYNLSEIFELVFICVLSLFPQKFLHHKIENKQPMQFIIFFIFIAQVLQADSFIINTYKIDIDSVEKPWNPSIAETRNGYYMTFRYTPDWSFHMNSSIGIVELNQFFVPTSDVQVLDTRVEGYSRRPDAEDARIIKHKDKYYVFYNDCTDMENAQGRRDMFSTEVTYKDGIFTNSIPQRLTHQNKYSTQMWQKNWVPFVADDHLLLSYSINPHEVVTSGGTTGICQPVCFSEQKINWRWGELRGGTPAQIVGDEYLAFFHSAIDMNHNGSPKRIYYMGAYTFEKKFPYRITKISPKPFVSKKIYSDDNKYSKRVIFPGGFSCNGPAIFLVYGKDDQETWVAEIDTKMLLDSLVPVEPMPLDTKVGDKKE